MQSRRLVLGWSFTVLFLLILFCPLVIGLNSLKQKYAVTSSNKIPLNSNLVIGKNMSALQCASECSKRASCCIAGYNKGTLECHLSDDCCPVTNVVSGWNVVSKDRRCENGWIKYCNFCYLIPSAQLSWQNAVNFCNGQNGVLIRLDNQNEYVWIVTQLRNIPVSTGYVWMAVVRSNGMMVYRSETGSDLQIPISFWGSGEPNGPAGISDCGAIVVSTAKWDDIRCSGTYQFVCKRLIS